MLKSVANPLRRADRGSSVKLVSRHCSHASVCVDLEEDDGRLRTVGAVRLACFNIDSTFLMFLSLRPIVSFNIVQIYFACGHVPPTLNCL